MSGSLSGFNVGIGGLRASAGAIESVSSNISNANTVGYKVSDYLFVDQYFRALSSTEVGRAAQGVSQTSVRRNYGQGAIRTTNSPLDLAINGQGFFRLCSKTGSDAGLVYYTRNGQLSVDKDGFIVNATGLYLTGYKANPRGDGVTNDLGPLTIPPAQRAPEASTEASLEVNLDARSSVKTAAGSSDPKSFNPDDDSTYAHATAFTIYDDSGNKSTVKVYYRRVLDGSATFKDEANQDTTQNVERYAMYMSVTDVDGKTTWVKATTQAAAAVTDNPATPGVDETAAAVKPVFETVDSAPAANTDDDASYNVAQRVGPDGKSLVQYLQFFGGKNTDSIYRDIKSGESVEKTKIAFNVRTGVSNENSQKITLSLTDTTRYSADFEVKSLSQDGFPIGALNSVSFDENGFLYGIYSNGKRLVAGRAALAQFKSQEGLSPIAQNLFAQTVASGEALLGFPGTGSYGVVRNTALEEANIDMASELVNLMIQQRNYQANSESIRAQDEILKSTISLAR